MKRNIVVIRMYGNKIGGTESATHMFLDLMGGKHNVELYYAIDSKENVKEMGKCIPGSLNKIKSRFLFWIKYFISIKRLTANFDYVVSTDIATSTLLLITRIFKRKIKVICWEHYPYNKNSLIWRGIFQLTKLHYLAHKVVCNSEVESVKLSFSKNVIVIPNAISLPEIQKEHRFSKPLHCTYIGRVVKDKGVDRLIQAFINSGNKDYQLNIVGGGDVLTHLKQKYSPCLNVLFHGPNSNTEQFFLKTDIFVSGSYYECFPITVLEAMSYGIPVVSMECSGGTSSVLSDSSAGYVCTSENEFLAKIDYLVDHKVRKERGEKGRSFVGGKYSKNEISGRWESIF